MDSTKITGINRFVALVGVAALALAVWVSTISPQAVLAGDLSSHSQKLEGSWLVMVTREDQSTFLSLMTFTSGGGVLEESNTTSIRSLGHGEWVRTGNRQFARTFVFFRFDGPTRGFIGTGRATANMRLGEDLNEFRAVARIERFDVNGNLIDTSTSTELGRRLEMAEPPELPD